MGYSHSRKYPLPAECSRNIIIDLSKIRDELATSSSFKARYLSTEMLRKYADPAADSASLRQQAAITKWLSVEACNRQTNQRLYLQHDEDLSVDGIAVDKLIERASRLIRRVLGESPPNDLHGSFSGGASTSQRRQVGMVERKYSGKLDVTQKAWDHIWPVIYRSQVWTSLNSDALAPEFVESSVMFTVPKTDTIDRVACKEPDYNMWMQKACGDFIRRRLRSRCNIDLNDQSVNKGLARVAVSLDLATLDLSSASDSVTTQLVCRLLPTDWFVYLDNLRVHSIILPDGTVHYPEMFSSMGNGFTFELESLIFWALSRSVCNKQDTVSVYGDDIIVPSSRYKSVVELLAYCGFTTNEAKSFSTGLFRESCGGHYYDGRDVTPFYVKGPISCVSQLINLLNSIRRWSRVEEQSSWCDDFFAPFWRTYSSYVPSHLHGGLDLYSTETLACPRGRGDRLVPARRVLHADWIERGSYIQWHSSRVNITSTHGLQRPSEQSAHWCTKAETGSSHSVGKSLNTFSVKRGVPKSYMSRKELPLFLFEVE